MDHRVGGQDFFLNTRTQADFHECSSARYLTLQLNRVALSAWERIWLELRPELLSRFQPLLPTIHSMMSRAETEPFLIPFRSTAEHLSRHRVFMSMTKRYRTSPWTVRSSASLTCWIGITSTSEVMLCSA